MSYDFHPQKQAVAWSLWQAELLTYACGYFQHRQDGDDTPYFISRVLGLKQRKFNESLVHQFLVAASGLFDQDFYRAKTNSASSRDALSHFLEHGATGLSPGPHFDSSRYLERYPDVKLAGANPLIHFILHGVAESRWDAITVDRPPLLRPPLSLDHGLHRRGRRRDATLRRLSEAAHASRERMRHQVYDVINQRAQLEVDLYGTRSDFQRAVIHNDRLMRDLASKRGEQSSESIDELTARIADMAEMIAALRDDAVEADVELVRWRERAETAERRGCELSERASHSEKT